jgi:large subunit ribosomal protein L22
MVVNTKEYIGSNNIVKSSPRKLGLVIDLIRGMRASEALTALRFVRKRVAVDVYKLLFSVVSNAQNNFGADIDSLFVKEVHCGKSISLRRFSPRARGRSYRIIKHYSKLRLSLAHLG